MFAGDILLKVCTQEVRKQPYSSEGERQLAEDKGRLNKANEMLAVDSDTDNTSSQALKMDRANESKTKEPLTTGINVQQAAEDEP